MIPLIKYNIPTINGRIYRKGCFINLDKIKDSFFIEKPRIDNDLNNIVSLSNVIFTAKLIEEDEGLFLSDLTFIPTDENKQFLSFFENKNLGISSRSIGHVDENHFVESAELIVADLVLDNSLTDNNHDFTYETNESKLILEFLPLDRYGEEFVSIKNKFISPGISTREND